MGAAATALMVLGACSSSGNTAGSTGGNTGSNTGSSGDITVGGVSDGEFQGVDVGFKARIDRFNKAGGVDGHKVNFIGVSDDGKSLSGDAAAVNKLVLQKKVFALAPYVTQTWSPSSTQTLVKAGTPYIGWAIAGPVQCQGDNAFPVTGCVNSGKYTQKTVFEQVSKAAGGGHPSIAIIGVDNAAAVSGVQLFRASAQAAGLNIVYAKNPISPGTTDYSPYVQAVMAEKPAVVYLLLDFTSSVSYTAALRQAGYQGKIVNPTAYVPGLLQSQKQLAAALTGSLVMSSFPPSEEDTAVSQQVTADLKADGASSTLQSLGVLVGWTSADQFVQELEATAKAGPLTKANFVKTIHAGFTYKPLAGGFTDISFPAKQTQPSTCIGLLTVTPKATYASASPFTCDPDNLVKLG